VTSSPRYIILKERLKLPDVKRALVKEKKKTEKFVGQDLTILGLFG